MKIATIWQGWISAVRFLTILPIGSPNHVFDARRALAFFPVCGLMIGAVAVLINTTASFLWETGAVSLLVVVGLAVLTGGLHLDGVADTADGLYGRRDPEKALSIMKDSRIGAVGAMVMVGCLAVKWMGLWGIDSQRVIWLLLVPAYARASTLLAIKFLPYGRSEGTGCSFFAEPIAAGDFWGLGLLFILSLSSGYRMVLLNLGFAVVVSSIIFFYRKKIGLITGDMMGAMIEITEALLFFILSAGDFLG